MRIITVRTEKNLNQLLDKYYSGLDAAEMKSLRDATLEANPHLRAAATFETGAVLILPDAKAGNVKNPATNDASAADEVAAIISALDAYMPVLEERIKAHREAMSQVGRLSKSAAFRKALEGAKSSDADELLESLTASLKVEDDGTKLSLAALPKSAAALKENLKNLQKKLGGSGH